MEISVTDAKAQLTELVRRAEAGDEVVLTRHGQPVARLVPLKKRLSPGARRAILDRLQAACADASPGADAAHSQDFLYDEHGLPK